MTDLQPIHYAAIGFGALQLCLVLLILTIRGALVATREKATDSFDPTGADLSPFAQRVTRAHANCIENLGVFAVILIVALGIGRVEVLNGLAYIFLGARILQTAVHLISTAEPVIMVRAGAFLTQVLIQVWWVVSLLRAA